MAERLEIHPLPSKPLDDLGWRLLSRAAGAYVELAKLTEKRNEVDGSASALEFGSIQFDRGVEFGKLQLLLQRLAEDYPYDRESSLGVNENMWHRAIQDSPTVHARLGTSVPS